MDRILGIDKKLTSLFANFNSIANELAMPLVCDIRKTDKIAAQKYSGIYRIDISTKGSPRDLAAWIEEFRAEWEHPDFLRRFTPNLKKMRIDRHTKLLPWMPLYIGKSKNVGARVLEHINLGLDKNTFALKLAARPTMTDRRFRLHTIALPVENYNILAPALESELRNRFNPIVGKQ
jgi:hypothetical protein